MGPGPKLRNLLEYFLLQHIKMVMVMLLLCLPCPAFAQPGPVRSENNLDIIFDGYDDRCEIRTARSRVK